MSDHGYTTHGHSLPGKTQHPEHRPQVANCGGPIICKQCRGEVKEAMKQMFQPPAEEPPENHAPDREHARMNTMTRLTQDDITQLRSTYATINVADEQLIAENRSFLRARLAEDAAQQIAHLAKLPHDSISPDELHVRQNPDPEIATQKLTFNWEPSTEHFPVELLGGPRDGERMMIQEHNKGHLRIAQLGQPAVTTEPDPFDGPEIKYGTYKETGWDTERKVWIYTWTDQ